MQCTGGKPVCRHFCPVWPMSTPAQFEFATEGGWGCSLDYAVLARLFGQLEGAPRLTAFGPDCAAWTDAHGEGYGLRWEEGALVASPLQGDPRARHRAWFEGPSPHQRSAQPPPEGYAVPGLRREEEPARADVDLARRRSGAWVTGGVASVWGVRCALRPLRDWRGGLDREDLFEEGGWDHVDLGPDCDLVITSRDHQLQGALMSGGRAILGSLTAEDLLALDDGLRWWYTLESAGQVPAAVDLAAVPSPTTRSSADAALREACHDSDWRAVVWALRDQSPERLAWQHGAAALTECPFEPVEVELRGCPLPKRDAVVFAADPAQPTPGRGRVQRRADGTWWWSGERRFHRVGWLSLTVDDQLFAGETRGEGAAAVTCVGPWRPDRSQAIQAGGVVDPLGRAGPFEVFGCGGWTLSAADGTFRLPTHGISPCSLSARLPGGTWGSPIISHGHRDLRDRGPWPEVTLTPGPP